MRRAWSRWRRRSLLAGALAILTSLGPSARAGEDGAPRDRKLAVGIKAGIIPPVFLVAEVVVRPHPHLATGLYGIVTRSGPGTGGTRTSIGAEITYEVRDPGVSTPYITASFDYYHAATDANGNFETMHTLYFTGGYLLKGRFVEGYFGGGILLVLFDELRPCSGFCLGTGPTPPFLFPTLELGLRFALF